MPPSVDLRSDTVTKPTPQMRAAMANAEVGDDGWGEDPTVIALEEAYAALVGKPAAVYVPSGVMANQIAVRLLTRPGDVVVTGPRHHLVAFELGAAARNAGVQFRTVDDSTGLLDPDAVRAAIDAVDYHEPPAGLVVVENTQMAAGGVPMPPEHMRSIAAASRGLPIHLDGARLFNAAVALGCRPDELAGPATTVMSCLSKGLCAPVGSVLAGEPDVIIEARDERKRLGGAMRQAGIIAAAGLVALRTMIDRLADDHARARRLADAVARTVAPHYDPASCRTNIVAFTHDDADGVVERLAALGVLGDTISPTVVRLVTHADVDDAMLTVAIDALGSI